MNKLTISKFLCKKWLNSLSSLKQYAFIISKLQWVRDWTWFSWDFCMRVSHKAAIKASERADVSSESSTGQGLTFKLLWLLAVLSSLQPLRLRSSASPHWLLSKGYPQPLATWIPQLDCCFVKMCKVVHELGPELLHVRSVNGQHTV